MTMTITITITIMIVVGSLECATNLDKRMKKLDIKISTVLPPPPPKKKKKHVSGNGRDSHKSIKFLEQGGWTPTDLGQGPPSRRTEMSNYGIFPTKMILGASCELPTDSLTYLFKNRLHPLAYGIRRYIKAPP